MSERWTSGRMFSFSGGSTEQRFAELDRFLNGELVVVEDTGAADTVVWLRHGLGRVPRGMLVVNQETGAGLGRVDWYRTVGDGDWTELAFCVRFTVANARVVLVVF